MAVIAIVVRESRFREKATRFDEAVDRPLRCLVPPDIESEQLRKELQLAVWKRAAFQACIDQFGVKEDGFNDKQIELVKSFSDGRQAED